MKKEQPVLLQEDKILDSRGLEMKLKKLEGYITKAQTRLKGHERAIKKLRANLKKEIKEMNRTMSKMQKIKVSV